MGKNFVLNGNKLIAKFEYGNLCENLDSDEDCLVRDSDTNYINFYVNDAKYHKSWDWLMPVVEKIENITFNIKNEVVTTWVHILGKGCFIDQRNKTIIMHPNLPEQNLTKLEAVYNAVVEFIKWYNESK